MSPAGHEPVIPASDQPQTFVLDRSTTAIGLYVAFLVWNTCSSLTFNAIGLVIYKSDFTFPLSRHFHYDLIFTTGFNQNSYEISPSRSTHMSAQTFTLSQNTNGNTRSELWYCTVTPFWSAVPVYDKMESFRWFPTLEEPAASIFRV